MEIFETHQDLIEEVLDELLLKGSRSEQSVKICAKQLGHEVAEKVSVGV